MNKLIGFGVIVSVVLSVVALTGDSERVIERVIETKVGASSGPEHYERQFFLAGAVDGGDYVSISTTSATYTLSANEVRGASVIDIESTGTGAALTLTLPATTTGAYPTRNGERVTFVVKNSHTASATTTTISAGTGVDLQETDGGNVVIGINNYAQVECIRLDTRDVACIVNEAIPAD